MNVSHPPATQLTVDLGEPTGSSDVRGLVAVEGVRRPAVPSKNRVGSKRVVLDAEHRACVVHLASQSVRCVGIFARVLEHSGEQCCATILAALAVVPDGSPDFIYFRTDSDRQPVHQLEQGAKPI